MTTMMVGMLMVMVTTVMMMCSDNDIRVLPLGHQYKISFYNKCNMAKTKPTLSESMLGMMVMLAMMMMKMLMTIMQI